MVQEKFLNLVDHNIYIEKNPITSLIDRNIIYDLMQHI